MIIPPYDAKSVRDWVAFQRQFDTFWQTATNGAELISHRASGIAEGATYYYGLTVPVGRMFILYTRALAVTEGTYHIDVVQTSGGYTGGTDALHSTLRAGADTTVQSQVKGGVTPVGDETVISYGFLDLGVGQGSGVSAGGLDDENVIKMYPAGTSLLRVDQVAGSGSWTANLRLICWELDAE